MGQRHWFQFISHGVLALFLAIILFVIIIAYTRDSGSMGLNMGMIQKMRYNALPHKSISSSPSQKLQKLGFDTLDLLRNLYPNNFKNWHFGCAKTPGLNDRKLLNID
jgi:hypothetical protein